VKDCVYYKARPFIKEGSKLNCKSYTESRRGSSKIYKINQLEVVE